MYKNLWITRSLEVIEDERIILKQSPATQTWYNKMPKILPAICPEVTQLQRPEDFGPQVGIVHHLRLTRFGIEAVMKAPRKYHRYYSYVLFDAIRKPNEPFWVVLHR